MAHRTRESGANPFIRRNDRRISTQSRTEAAANGDVIVLGGLAVSTHSRAKAAAWKITHVLKIVIRFNTQPREGGCSLLKKARKISVLNTVFR